MSHHAVIDVIDRLRMTIATGFLRHAQVPGIHKLDELRRLVIEQHVTVVGIRRAFKEHRIARSRVGLAHRQARGRVTAVAIGAAETDKLAAMRISRPFVTAQATAAFLHHGFLRLIDLVGLRNCGVFARQGLRRSDRWAEDASNSRRHCLGMTRHGQDDGGQGTGDAEMDRETGHRQKVMVAERKPL